MIVIVPVAQSSLAAEGGWLVLDYVLGQLDLANLDGGVFLSVGWPTDRKLAERRAACERHISDSLRDALCRAREPIDMLTDRGIDLLGHCMRLERRLRRIRRAVRRLMGRGWERY